jgi:ribosomal 30S subunit maturation factor RimM
MDPAGDALVVLGEVVGSYGVRGWLKIRPFTERPETLLGHATWWLKARDHGWRLARRGYRCARGFAALTAGEVIRGPRRPCGDQPLRREARRVGSVLETGAHRSRGWRRGGDEGERLIPLVPAYVDAIDIAGDRTWSTGNRTID